MYFFFMYIQTVANGQADQILRALRVSGVNLYGGEKAVLVGLTRERAPDLHKEYGDLCMSVEVLKICNVQCVYIYI